jgi:hypothetical protein
VSITPKREGPARVAPAGPKFSETAGCQLA